MNPLFSAAVLAVVLLVGASARADVAPPEFQIYLVQHHYGAVRTDTDDENRQSFDAKINGQPVHLILDTGASRTTITANCAHRLGLTVKDSGKPAMGAGGKTFSNLGIAAISSFKIHDWEINHLNVVDVLSQGSASFGGADGLFGLDSLRLNDAIMVLGGGGFLIRPGMIGPGAPISDFMRQRGFSPVGLTFPDGRIRVDGTLNGHPMRTQIDCGAAYSTFRTEYLRKLDVPTHWVPVTMNGVDGREMKAQEFTPDELTLGNFHVPRHEMLSTSSGWMDQSSIDALLGFDFLVFRSAVIDMGSGILWMK